MRPQCRLLSHAASQAACPGKWSDMHSEVERISRIRLGRSKCLALSVKLRFSFFLRSTPPTLILQ